MKPFGRYCGRSYFGYQRRINPATKFNYQFIIRIFRDIETSFLATYLKYNFKSAVRNSLETKLSLQFVNNWNLEVKSSYNKNVLIKLLLYVLLA